MSTVKSSSEDLTLNADGSGNDVVIQGNGTNTATITAEGLLKYNSGYGSVATAYGCRAWVNFNGTGTVAIRGSGNVSSITDNGLGDYTVNFTTAMPDANFNVVGMVCATSDGNKSSLRGISLYGPASITTTTARIRTMNGINTAAYDAETTSVSIFR
jgi:hypothetical protein|tara:strand:+ start:1294 stop:1764 length:471 start_codon:yes stop_codon:yes gene_type:complete